VLLIASCSGCGKSGGPVGGAAGGNADAASEHPGGGGGAGGAGGGQTDAGADGVNDGGGGDAPLQTTTRVRFVQAFIGDNVTGNPGATGAYDVWTRDPTQTWVSIYRSLPYAQPTEFRSVTVTNQHLKLWFVAPGSDPASAPSSATSDVSQLLIPAGDTGRHTALAYNFFGSWAVNVVSDDDPAAVPPVGQTNIIFNTAAIAEMFAGYGFNYGRTGLCLNSLTAEGRYTAIDPGTFQFSLYDAHFTDCNGPVVVSAPATTYSAGEAWVLFGLGDNAPNGYQLLPVKLGGN
jgi:hypothetical protein